MSSLRNEDLNSLDGWYQDYGWVKVKARAIEENELGAASALCKHGMQMPLAEFNYDEDNCEKTCFCEGYITSLEIMDALEIPSQLRNPSVRTDVRMD